MVVWRDLVDGVGVGEQVRPAFLEIGAQVLVFVVQWRAVQDGSTDAHGFAGQPLLDSLGVYQAVNSGDEFAEGWLFHPGISTPVADRRKAGKPDRDDVHRGVAGAVAHDAEPHGSETPRDSGTHRSRDLAAGPVGAVPAVKYDSTPAAF